MPLNQARPDQQGAPTGPIYLARDGEIGWPGGELGGTLTAADPGQVATSRKGRPQAASPARATLSLHDLGVAHAALLYTRFVGARYARIAGLMQATTLTFVIVATQIGLAAGLINSTTSASLLTAGLLSAALFPAAALRLLAAGGPAAEPTRGQQ